MESYADFVEAILTHEYAARRAQPAGTDETLRPASSQNPGRL